MLNLISVSLCVMIYKYVMIFIVGELRCSGMVSSSFSASDTRRINLCTNSVISHEWGEDREVFRVRYDLQAFHSHCRVFKYFPVTVWSSSISQSM
jgi:hypothetical protein